MQKIKQNFKYLFLAILVLSAVFVWYVVFSESRSGLLVVFLDVGEGDAIFIQAENGNQILIDGGKDKKVLSELSKVMPFYDRSIDVVLETHPDADHIGGLVEVLKRYNVGAVVEPSVNSDSAVNNEFEKIVNEKNIREFEAKRGMKIDLGGGVFLSVLFPDRETEGVDTNVGSVVAKLVYGKTSFLLTGDSPENVEKYLVFLDESSPADELKSDVLKVGHHGSKTSTAELFLGYVSPDYAVISLGVDNKYGHPVPEIIERLKKIDVNILRTD